MHKLLWKFIPACDNSNIFIRVEKSLPIFGPCSTSGEEALMDNCFTSRGDGLFIVDIKEMAYRQVVSKIVSVEWSYTEPWGTPLNALATCDKVPLTLTWKEGFNPLYNRRLFQSFFLNE